MPAVTLRDSKSRIQTDPLRNFKFQVNIAKAGIPDMIRLGFMSCDGLAVNTDMIPYREGGNNTTPRKLPGQSNFSPISLSRGCVMGTRQMWNWFREIFFVTQGGGRGRAGNNFRQDFVINLLDHPVTLGRTPIKMRWRVYNAWPTVLQYSTLDAGGNGIEIEQMTLENEGWNLEWASPARGASL